VSRTTAHPASLRLGSHVAPWCSPDGPDDRFLGKLAAEPYKLTLTRMIEHVIKIEAPIYEDLLIERVARAHGFQRSGDF
jgi:hypothetical protein